MSLLELVEATPTDPTAAAPEVERIAARLVDPPRELVLGSYTLIDATPSAQAPPGQPQPEPVTRLVVDDGSDFDDSGQGGWIRLRFTADGTGPDAVLPYATWGGDETDVEYVELTDPLAVTVPAGTMVDVWDPTDETAESFYEAIVMLDDPDPETRAFEVTVKQDIIDTIPEGLTLGRGQSVTLERRRGEDEITLVQVEGVLVRDGSKTPMTVDALATAHSAEDRATGRKWAKVVTSLLGARAEMLSDANGGMFRIINAAEEVVGVIRATVEGGVQRLIVGTGGDNPVRLRFFNGPSDRSIDALCNVFNIFGLIQGTQGLTLQQSPAILKGFDRFTNVTRVTSDNGVCQVQHNLAATGSMTQPFVKFSDPNASPPPVGPEDVEILLDGTEAGGIVRFRVVWRSGPRADRPNGVAGGERVVNRTVTFDYGLESVER